MKAICEFFSIHHGYNKYNNIQAFINKVTLSFKNPEKELEYQQSCVYFQLSMFRISTVIQIVVSICYIIITRLAYHTEYYQFLRGLFLFWLIFSLWLHTIIKSSMKSLIMDIILAFNTFCNLSIAYDFLVIETNQESQVSFISGAIQCLLAYTSVNAAFFWLTKSIIVLQVCLAVMVIGDATHSIYFITFIIIVVCIFIMFRIEDQNKRKNYLRLENEYQNTIACRNLFDSCVGQCLVVLSKGQVAYVNNYTKQSWCLQDNQNVLHSLNQIFVNNKPLLEMIEEEELTLNESESHEYQLLSNIQEYRGIQKIDNIIQEDENNRIFQIRVAKCLWDGQISQIIVCNDITDRLNNQKYKELNLYKDQLLATVSHDLKTPLNSISIIILVVLQILQEVAENQSLSFNKVKEIQKLLCEVKKNEVLLLSMVNDLLDMNQISRGILRLQIKQFDLQDTILAVKSLFQSQAQIKNITINTIINLQDNHIINDENRLKQVLINIVGNALKFTFQGKIDIEVNVKDSELYQINVRDTGIGIPQEIQLRLFQLYNTFNLKNQNTHGVGIGLSISKQLVGQLGPLEQIDLKSEVDKGSDFSFLIYKISNQYKQKSFDITDIGQNSEESVHLLPNLQNSQLSRRKQSDHQKVLIVDDTPINILALKSMLKKFFNHIFLLEEAYNGKQALQLFETSTYDVVFMDLNMPIMGGLDAIRAMRKFEKEKKLKSTRIIVTSAFTSEEDIQSSLDAGANKHVEKPITLIQLQNIFNNHM